jgi:hypothetical protein
MPTYQRHVGRQSLAAVPRPGEPLRRGRAPSVGMGMPTYVQNASGGNPLPP